MRRRALIILMAMAAMLVVGGAFNTAWAQAECEDGVDNDGDGLIDFAGGPGGEAPDGGCSSATDNSEQTKCQDGVDNDNDGTTDFGDDPGCVSINDANETRAAGPECDDNIDNDGDGFIDVGGGDNPGEDPPGDPECESPTDTSESNGNGDGTGTGPVTECSDGLDNDHDGAVDGFDRDCESPGDFHEIGSEEPECSDGLDNDGDGKIDFGPDPEHNDPDCESDDDDSEAGAPPTAECNDGIDNDGDGLIDFAGDGDDDGGEGQQDDGDPDCTDVNDNHEKGDEPPPECNDGIDNDGDGLIDFIDDGDDDGEEGPEDDGDPDCESADDPSESGGIPTCMEDENADGTTRSTFAPNEDEVGLISSIVYDIDKGVLYPTGIPIVTGEGGVVAEVDCAIIRGVVESLLGL